MEDSAIFRLKYSSKPVLRVHCGLKKKKGGLHRARRSNPFVVEKKLFFMFKNHLQTQDPFMVLQESLVLLTCRIFWGIKISKNAALAALGVHPRPLLL